MEKVGNVEVYADDIEIIEILQQIPASKDFGNQTVLSLIQNESVKQDFGTVIFYEGIAYTVYKFDKDLIKVEDAGLILTKSDEKFVLEQLHIWKSFEEAGMSFSDKIFELIKDSLTGHYLAQQFYSSYKNRS